MGEEKLREGVRSGEQQFGVGENFRGEEVYFITRICNGLNPMVRK